MEIDEDRKYVLTKYSSRMGLKCVSESDHNVLICRLKLKWNNRIRTERKEIFNLKDKEGLKLFSELTSNCPQLINLSNNSSDFLADAEKWMNKIEDIKHKSFKKIRLTSKPKPQNPELNSLMLTKQNLITRLVDIVDPVLKRKLNENIHLIEKEISIICSERNAKTVKEHIRELSTNSEQVHRLNMWRLKQKLCPQNIDPPMAKKNKEGELISNPDKLKQL